MIYEIDVNIRHSRGHREKGSHSHSSHRDVVCRDRCVRPPPFSPHPSTFMLLTWILRNPVNLVLALLGADYRRIKTLEIVQSKAETAPARHP